MLHYVVVAAFFDQPRLDMARIQAQLANQGETRHEGETREYVPSQLGSTVITYVLHEIVPLCLPVGNEFLDLEATSPRQHQRQPEPFRS